MTISYNWLSEYLPENLTPEKLSKILTAVGLEVESLEPYESIKGGLKGVVTGKVLTCEAHPNADKLKITTVDIGSEVLTIVCGAANVATGQKVVVATVGSLIYPITGNPIEIKAAKIRGELSQGMICAEDEIGVGTSHDGILVLPGGVDVGLPATAYFKTYTDWIYEIGLTPNRMDAMSHFGVARDVCAYLTHHNKVEIKPKSPFITNVKPDSNQLPIKVTIENKDNCLRYAGVSISNIVVKESPEWLKQKLVAIGQRPINNVVDITNYMLQESGQPLHAFDIDAIEGNQVIVRNAGENNSFITLDGKERKLFAEDLMICNASEAMCIAGVFGGSKSGVKASTTSIFLESACFNPISIRKTSTRHGLRTEAASRFEKGVDISNVMQVLKRAAVLIKELAGGEISSDFTDVYPDPKPKQEVAIKYHYLKKLSGKNYHPDAVKRILTSLGFEVLKEGMDELRVAVPFSKPDISLPADIVEEVLRIDGLDNIEFTGAMTFTPSIDESIHKELLRERIAGYLIGLGCSEIVTNSITNSQYYTDDVLRSTVKMINSLSADLNVMRPAMLETGLETIAYNINRKNSNLQLYEFGKTYHTVGVGNYTEAEQLVIYYTGKVRGSWQQKERNIDLYTIKGIAESLSVICGFDSLQFEEQKSDDFHILLHGISSEKNVLSIGEISATKLKIFDIKQPVFYINFNWKMLEQACSEKITTYREVSRFPAVNRDLAIVVDKGITFGDIELLVKKQGLSRLSSIELFDIFESEKLGAGKKSLAISLTFTHEEKTMTDKEIDEMINKIISGLQNGLNAEIRK